MWLGHRGGSVADLRRPGESQPASPASLRDEDEFQAAYNQYGGEQFGCSRLWATGTFGGCSGLSWPHRAWRAGTLAVGRREGAMPGGVLEGRAVPADPAGFVAAGVVGSRAGAHIPGSPPSGARGSVLDGSRAAPHAEAAFIARHGWVPCRGPACRVQLRTTFDQVHRVSGCPWLRQGSDRNSGPLAQLIVARWARQADISTLVDAEYGTNRSNRFFVVSARTLSVRWAGSRSSVRSEHSSSRRGAESYARASITRLRTWTRRWRSSPSSAWSWKAGARA